MSNSGYKGFLCLFLEKTSFLEIYIINNYHSDHNKQQKLMLFPIGKRAMELSGQPINKPPTFSASPKYGWLYRKCLETEGVEYVGSVPQSELAKQLQSVTVFAYPNTYPETSCIAVMEAMASGCWVVTSNLGALLETTAGFASLISWDEGREVYKQKFIEETIKALRKCTAENSTEAEEHLRKQVNFVNNAYSWSGRALEWAEWLARLSGDRHFTVGDYQKAAKFYQEAIAANPDLKSNYWYCGLSWLLQGEPENAEGIWMSAILDEDLQETDQAIEELGKVLQAEITNLESRGDKEHSLLLQDCLKTISTMLNY
jgi:tetratricopeptide (TPR) repeat protein